MSSTIEAEEIKKIDILLSLLDKSGVCDFLKNKIEEKEKTVNGRPSFNPYDLLVAIIYSFAFGKGSLRDIEELCTYDLRLIYIMNNNIPSYKTIGNFINDYILPNEYEIFYLITKSIYEYIGLSIDNIYIDGSKFEANANKYKFVWKPTTFHIKLSNKIRMILEKYDLLRGIPLEGIIDSKLVAIKLTELADKLKSIDLNDKENKKQLKDLDELTICLNKSLDYEEKERICGPNRNSYYKTDLDATAMCLKEDYYSGLGSNMHAGYNVQLSVSDGLINTYLITQSRNDYSDFIKVLDKYFELYKTYPKTVCADSGYGNYDNYLYLKKHNIKSFVKHQSWEGNKSGKSPSQFKINDKDTIICLNGNIGSIVILPYIHKRKKNSVFYKVDGCDNCGFSSYCKRFMKNKDEPFKIFEVVKEYQELIEESERNLLSIEGIEARVNRSIEVEGAFGIIKQDYMYNRFRRTRLKKVSTEFMLVSLGFNIRKLFSFISSNKKTSFWKAPENIKPEIFKKPSAKRLSNKANKTKEKSVNEIAKSTYKY